MPTVEEPGKPSGVGPSAFGNETWVLLPNITFPVGGITSTGNDALVLAADTKLSMGGSAVSGVVAVVLESSKTKGSAAVALDSVAKFTWAVEFNFKLEHA